MGALEHRSAALDAVRQVTRTSGSVEPKSQQEVAPEDVDAAAYRAANARAIGEGITAYLDAHPVSGAHPFVMFDAVHGIVRDRGKAIEARLDQLLGAERVLQLIDRGRTMGKTTVDDHGAIRTERKGQHGPASWSPDVAIELAAALREAIERSLARIFPRWIQAAVAEGRAADVEHRPFPRPFSAAVVPSTPTDVLVLDALDRTAIFDWNGYRDAHPDATGHREQLRPVTIVWEPPRRAGGFWARVEKPADATLEEVAMALYGTPTATERIRVAARPLYGLDTTMGLVPAHLEQLGTIATSTELLSIHGDAVRHAMNGPSMAEIEKAQGHEMAQSLATSNLDVVAVLDRSLALLRGIARTAHRFGVGPLVEGLQMRLQVRRSTFARDSNDALGWADHAEAQERVLQHIAFSMFEHGTRLDELQRLVDDAARKLGAFDQPSYVRDAMHRVAELYAQAASASELPATAHELLNVADRESHLLPVTFLEGTLATIREQIDDLHKPKQKAQGGNVGYSDTELRKRESALRARAAALRSGDAAAFALELKALTEMVNDLSVETTVVTRFDAIDAGWDELQQSQSSWTRVGTKILNRLLIEEGQVYYLRWKKIYADWKSGDPDRKAHARQQLEEQRNDQALHAWFKNLRKNINAAQIIERLDKLAAVLAISFLTMGIATAVSGAVEGWGMGVTARALVVGGTEAFTFSTLNLLVDDDRSLKHILTGLVTNFAASSLTRRFGAFAQANKWSKADQLGASVMMQSAFTFASAEIDKYVSTGKHLTNEDVQQIAAQGLLLAIANHTVATVSKPLLSALEGKGYAFGAKLRANNLTREILEIRAASLKARAEREAVREYLEAERAWLEERLSVLAEIEAAAQRDPKLRLRLSMTPEELEATRAQLGQALSALTDLQLPMLYLEPIGPGMFTCPREHIYVVLHSLENDGGEVKVTMDRETSVRTFEVGGPIKMTILETIPPGTGLELSTPDPNYPLLEQVDGVTGVRREPGYEIAMNELKKFYAQQNLEAKNMIHVAGAKVDGNYLVQYQSGVRQFSHGVTSVTFKLHLQTNGIGPGGVDTGPTGATAADVDAVKNRIVYAVDHYYNWQHDVTAIDGKRSRLHVEVVFVNTPDEADAVVGVHPGQGRANAANFYADSHPIVDAHEVGHAAFGLVDEYVDRDGGQDRRTPRGPQVFLDGLMSNFWLETEQRYVVHDGHGRPIARPGTSLMPRNIEQIGKNIRDESP